MSYDTFRRYIGEIDKALDTIKRAQAIPSEYARRQSCLELKSHYDGYFKPTPEMLVAGNAVLAKLVDDARRAGEMERDAIIAKQVAIIESHRANLSNAIGSAIIDLGCIARASKDGAI